MSKNEMIPATNYTALKDFNLAEAMASEMNGMDVSFDRVTIPAAGGTTFELPGELPGETDAAKEFTGVILYHHPLFAYYRERFTGGNNAPDCGSYDGVTGVGNPGGVCAQCPLNQFGSGENGGKACKNMRVLYLLRSGEFMPLAINLSPTSISPFREFLNQGFVFRNRATYGSLVEIGLKRQTNPEGKDYSVATFKRLGDFHGDQLAAVRKYALSFREQIRGMNRQRIEAKREQDDGLCEVESYAAVPAATDDSFCIGATVNGDTQPLPA